MKIMTYSESRAKYAETLDSVVNDREEVVITRAGHDPVVIVSLDEYESLVETVYLRSNDWSPAAAPSTNSLNEARLASAGPNWTWKRPASVTASRSSREQATRLP